MNKILSAVATTVFAAALCTCAQAQDHRDDRHDDHHDNGQSMDHHENDRSMDRHDSNRPGDPRGNNDQGDHRDNGHYVQHKEWRKGYRMNHEDWNRGERVDYRSRHLSAPPRGYEWRQVDGNYVMASIATGVIASLMAASR